MFTFKFVKTRTDAVAPKKNTSEDTGYDVTILEPVKAYKDVTLYTTGLIVQPSDGYYFDLVARSSISKTGYMLANGVGIIDQNYRGEVLVALRKVDQLASDIQLPIKIAQLIPRKVYDCEPEEITQSKLIKTKRGEGGFGSSN